MIDIKNRLGLRVKRWADKLDKDKTTRDELRDEIQASVEDLISEIFQEWKSFEVDKIKNQYQEKLQEERIKITQEINKIVNNDPRFLAANMAVKQAEEAAGVDSRTWNYKSEPFIRDQLVRTIGVIWAAAFGVQIIGNGNGDKREDTKKRAKNNAFIED